MPHPLKIDVAQFGRANTDHIRDCLERGLPELHPAPFGHDGNMVVVGSGPSMPDFTEEIRKESASGRPIVAINGAHDYLIDNGIVPDAFLTCDPRPMPQNFKRINDQTIYLLASRCHPDTFDTLKERRVLVWHSYGEAEENQLLHGKMAIGGGTSSGLRCINVGYVLGYRNFTLYGIDSCLAADRKTKRFDGGQSGAIVDVIVNGKTFWCNYAMAQQAQDFQYVYEVMPDLKIEAKGPGLIAEIIKERKRMGMAA